MLSFGDLRNNLKKLEDLNKNMNILSKIKWNKSALDEKQIKNQPVEFYLRIIHFALTDYSTQFYRLILESLPNIKTLPDQKFIENTLNLSRKLFGMSPKINAQQFLQSSKLIQKKLEFTVQLCENIYNWHLNTLKRNKKQNNNENKFQNPNKFSPEKVNPIDDEDDEIEERSINIKPTTFTEQELKANFTQPRQPVKVESNKPVTFSIEDKETVSMLKGKTFPKRLQNAFAEDEEQQNQFIPASRSKQKLTQQPTYYPIQNEVIQHHEQSGRQAVSRQELNEVLYMISTLNTTINSLVSKFGDFQTYVSTELTKINARISLLEENVKIIKANL